MLYQDYYKYSVNLVAYKALRIQAECNVCLYLHWKKMLSPLINYEFIYGFVIGKENNLQVVADRKYCTRCKIFAG